MKKLPYFRQSNLVAEKLLSSKLTFLCGVYQNNRLVSAQMYEQNLAVSPDEKDEEPVFVKDLPLTQMPVLFSMSGGHRWLCKLEQSFDGLQMICVHANHGYLKAVKQVHFEVLTRYADNTSVCHDLYETGKTFAFKSCHCLELEHHFNGKTKSFRPVYRLDENEDGFAKFEGLYPRTKNDEKLRLLGCYVYERGRFCNFVLAECLPKELANYFSL
ncbi:MAG: hypothetical protein MR350_03740 [Alphaproteobacteria bacterium]|nr:hypothetical protein [Alphaproteobacteria bacterium]